MTKHKGRTVPPQPTAALDTSERRVRACLKACEGLSTATLEAGNLKLMLDALPRFHSALWHVSQSLDEVCTSPDGLAQLRAVVDSLYTGVGKMCDGAGRPRAPDAGAQL